MIQNPFSNLKVLDFSQHVAGPLVTKTLADYGATVVLVESMKVIPQERFGTPYKDNKPGVNQSGRFAFITANKYSISLDMKHPQGLEIAKKLVAWSDIVAENFRPGVMESWHLGYDVLREIRPDIIMLRSSALGQTGPGRSYKAFGTYLNSLAGFFHLTGWPDGEPIPIPFAYSDFWVAWLAVPLLCAALDYRHRTGLGQMIDLSQLEVVLQFVAPYLIEKSVNKEGLMRRGNQHPYAVPHDVYHCKGDDCWCSIAVFTDEEWRSFCKVLGNPIWTQDTKFATFSSRKRNEEELNKLVGEWTVSRTPEEVMELMQAAGVASGIAKKAKDVFEDPQLNKREFYWNMNHKVIGDFAHMGEPSILYKTPAKPRLPSPCLGEHTEYVCKEFLGMTDEEISENMAAGAFAF